MNDGTADGDDLFAAKINLNQADVTGDLFGLVITNAATAAVVGTDDVECLLCLDNVENTAALVSDAIRITNSGGTDTAITTGLDFDATGIVTDIELQNGETIDNNVDGTIQLTGAVAVSGITTLTGNLNANGGLDVDDAFVVADGGVLTTSQTANFDGKADI